MTHPDDVPNDLPNEPPGAREAPDAPLDPAVRAAARAYHVPPPLPGDAREAMWAAIRARRAAPGASADATPAPAAPALAAPPASAGRADVHRDDLTVRRLALRGRAARRWAPLAAAAVLLFAAGVEVGRNAGQGGPPATPVAAGPAPETSAGGAPPPDVASMPNVPSVPNGSGGRGAPARAPDATPRASRRPEVASARGGDAPAAPVVASPAPAPGAPAPARAAPSAPLRVATEQHLARAEALLTTFAAQRPGGDASGPPPAAPDSAWARDLLTTTRLLLDSPAARDPARRALLEDLELVLAQIARLPRADTPAERALIDGAIRRGDLLAKLRTAVPAGAPAPEGARGT